MNVSEAISEFGIAARDTGKPLMLTRRLVSSEDACPLTLQDVDLALRNGWFSADDVFAVRAGLQISGSALSDEDVVSSDRARRVLSGGASLVLLGLQRRFGRVNALGRHLRSVLRHDIHVNGYLTPRGATALPQHSDPYSVIVVQVAGQKAWTLPDASAPVTLRVGDCLYMRSGTQHAATAATEQPSLHLTIAIRDDLPGLAEASRPTITPLLEHLRGAPASAGS